MMDIYKEIAAKMYGIPAEEVTPEMRATAKKASLFVGYGATTPEDHAMYNELNDVLDGSGHMPGYYPLLERMRDRLQAQAVPTKDPVDGGE